MHPLSPEQCLNGVTLLVQRFDAQLLDAFLVKSFHIRLTWVAPAAGTARQYAEVVDFFNRHGAARQLFVAAGDYPPPLENLREFARGLPDAPAQANEMLTVLIADAVKALNNVPAMLTTSDEARKRLVAFASTYQRAAEHIELMGRYKGLHECLHLIQLKQREIIRASRELRDEAASLRIYSDELEDVVDRGRSLADLLNNPVPERTWLGNLGRAVDHLREAADHLNADAAEEAIRLIDRTISRDPVRIHELIVRHVQGISLATLVDSLQSVVDVVPSAGERDLMNAGLTGLTTLDARLTRLMAEHTAWQNLDNSLRLALETWYELIAEERRRIAERSAVPGAVANTHDDSESLTRYANRLLEDWPDVASCFSVVRVLAPTERRLQRLDGYAARLADAALERDYGAVFEAFEPFSQQALARFVEVDGQLLALARQMQPIADPIRTILEVIAP